MELIGVCSLLTNISEIESPKSTPRSICLYVDARIVGFQRNDDPNIDEYMEKIFERFGWEKYKYQCKKFGIPALQAIKRCLNGESHLDLAHYIPQSIGTVYAFEILNEKPENKITHIDLTDCPMTETGCVTLSYFIGRKSPLEHLNLKNTRIGRKGVETLEEGLFVNRSLKYINLSGCNISDEGAVVLARALNGNDVCKNLDISHNNLYLECGDAIKTILTTTNIEELNLGWNELYMDKSVNKIFQGVRDNTCLKHLNFSWNGLSGLEWPKSLKQAVIKNVTLEILNLENNRLTNVADQIMPAIMKSQSLKELYLGANPWTEQDYTNILKVFQKESNLNILSLGNDTYLTMDCAKLIMKAVHINPDLNIIFKGQILDRPLDVVDFQGILADRMKFLAMKPKKKKLKRNMGHFFLKLKEENVEYDEMDNFIQKLTAFGAKLDAQLIEQVAQAWLVVGNDKKKKTEEVGLLEMCNYYLTRHPTEPPVIVQKKKKGKGDKKGKKGKKEGKKGEKKKKGGKGKKGKKGKTK